MIAKIKNILFLSLIMFFMLIFTSFTSQHESKYELLAMFYLSANFENPSIVDTLIDIEPNTSEFLSITPVTKDSMQVVVRARNNNKFKKNERLRFRYEIINDTIRIYTNYKALKVRKVINLKDKESDSILFEPEFHYENKIYNDSLIFQDYKFRCIHGEYLLLENDGFFYLFVTKHIMNKYKNALRKKEVKLNNFLKIIDTKIYFKD